MSFTLNNWAEISVSLNQGQETITPYGGSATVENAPNVFFYGSPNDTVATISASNYFLPQYASLCVGDWIMGNGTDASFSLVVTAVSSTSVTTASTGLTTSIGTANIVNGAVTGVKLANPLVGSGSGFTFDDTTASATPGTVRALKGLMTGTNATMTSGNLTGVRGEVDLVGASGGFVYGVQGKVIPTGTLSGSVWAPAVFGQYDLSGATLNAGQIAAIWGDMGATGGTFTDVTGARMFAGTNTIASLTLNSMIYLYGKATSLFELSGSSSTYISAAAGATPSGDLQKLAITIDGVVHYILAAAVYS
jgi:hypothetical protein